MNEEKNVLVGIYTLSHKAIEITNTNISNTTRKKLLRYAALDKDTDKYNQSNIFSPIRDAGTIPKHRQCGNGLLTSVFHWRMTF